MVTVFLVGFQTFTHQSWLFTQYQTKYNFVVVFCPYSTWMIWYAVFNVPQFHHQHSFSSLHSIITSIMIKFRYAGFLCLCSTSSSPTSGFAFNRTSYIFLYYIILSYLILSDLILQYDILHLILSPTSDFSSPQKPSQLCLLLVIC